MPRRWDRAASGLMVIDLQERLTPAIAGADRVLARARLAMAAARLYGAPILITEQYPRGLGRTVTAIDLGDAPVLEKTSFDACRAAGFDATAVAAVAAVALVGCEAHVCVLQTALGLLDRGKRVAVVADAVGSRDPADAERALARLAQAGVELLSAEMLAFEWAEDAADPRFKALSGLVKAATPSAK